MSTRIPNIDRNGQSSVDVQSILDRARTLRSHAITSMLRAAGQRIAWIARRTSAPTALTPPWQHRRPQLAGARSAS